MNQRVKTRQGCSGNWGQSPPMLPNRTGCHDRKLKNKPQGSCESLTVHHCQHRPQVGSICVGSYVCSTYRLANWLQCFDLSPMILRSQRCLHTHANHCYYASSLNLHTCYVPFMLQHQHTRQIALLGAEMHSYNLSGLHLTYSNCGVEWC